MSTPLTSPVPTPAWVERASDWLNPILVKEARQSLKSRQFLGTFLLMLTAAWLISTFGLLWQGGGLETRGAGREFFWWYYMVLSAAIFVVIPFGAYRSLLSERDQQTYEVLSITTLKPRQIVLGKLLSSLLQVFIFYSAITPFLAFTYLLKGIDIATIAYVLVMAMFWSMGLSMICLTISTSARNRHLQGLSTIVVLVALVIGFFFPMVGLFRGMGMLGVIAFDHPDFWWEKAAEATLYVGYFFLLLQIATAQLTFDADNRSTGTRLALSGLFWLATAWVCFWVLIASSSTSDAVEFYAWMVGLHLAGFGLFAVTEPDTLSRRVRRDLDRFRKWRLILAPFMPGGSRGYLYVLMHLAVLWLLFTFGAPWLPPSGQTVINGLCLYIVIYLGIAAAITRLGRSISSEFRPMHARVLLALIVAIGATAPHLIWMLIDRRGQFFMSNIWYVTNPFYTLDNLSRADVFPGEILLLLTVCAVFSVLINARAVWNGFWEIAAAPKETSQIESFTTETQRH